MRFAVIARFPGLYRPFLGTGVTRSAFEGKLVDVRLWPLRDFAEGAYRRGDDRPVGGGPGMVMLAEPLWQCLQAVRAERGVDAAPVVLFFPPGPPTDHPLVAREAQGPGAPLVCGPH